MGAGNNLDQTSALYVSIVIVGFVFLSKIIEHGFEHAVHYLHHHHEISLVAVVEHVKDEIMLVGTLSMFLIFVENTLATWCVPENNEFVPALNHEACIPYYSSSSTAGNGSTGSASSSGRRAMGSTRQLLAASSGSDAPITCGAGETFFVEVKALHQAHFLIFYLSLTHIIYSIVAILTARAWAKSYETWESDVILGGGKMVPDEDFNVPERPKGLVKEYAYAFYKQFTFTIDHTTASLLRQFYIVTQNKPKDYHFFSVVKEELEMDFSEICGLDTILWIYTAATMWTEGMPNSSKGGDVPVGTFFGCFVCFVLGTKMLILVQRLTEQVYHRMKANNAALEQFERKTESASEGSHGHGSHGHDAAHANRTMDQLTEKQLIDIKHTFSMWDTSGDGAINQEELKDMLKSLGHDVTAAQCEEMIASVDFSKDGTMHFGEFLMIMETFHISEPNLKQNIFQGISMDFGPGLRMNGPKLMLWGIKLVMFQFSQKICFTIFYFQQFKDADGNYGKGCYILSRTTASLVTSNLVNALMCFYIGLVLVPLYSMTKHVAMHKRKLGHLHKLALGAKNAVAKLTSTHVSVPSSSGDAAIVPIKGVGSDTPSKYVVVDESAKNLPGGHPDKLR